jgi:hypothetical protein
MKKLALLFVVAMAVGLLSWNMPAQGSITNERPVYVGDNGIEDSLQEVFDAITIGGTTLNAVDDQSPYAVFKNNASGGAVATMVIQITAYDETTSFGLYKLGDTTKKAQVFAGGADPGDQALVSFMANGDIKVNGTVVANDFGPYFGFYINPNGNQDLSFYTQDSENPNGDAQALVYQGNDSTLQIPNLNPGQFDPSEFIIAWEDTVLSGSDKDYQDMVVLVESISPYVPEPASVLIWSAVFGASGAGLAVRRRRRIGGCWTEENREAILRIIHRDFHN